MRTERRAVLLGLVHPVHTTMSHKRAQPTASSLAPAVQGWFGESDVHGRQVPLASCEKALEDVQDAAEVVEGLKRLWFVCEQCLLPPVRCGLINLVAPTACTQGQCRSTTDRQKARCALAGPRYGSCLLWMSCE